MFISDNGMAVPFAKANCYLNSTKTPWIVRWPGRVTPGSVLDRRFDTDASAFRFSVGYSPDPAVAARASARSFA